MSFCKMVFYLKVAHIMVRCNHVRLQKFVYSVTKNDKVNKWSQEIHSITHHIEVEHTKGKENVLADSLSRLRLLGLRDDNDHVESGQEYSESIFDMDKNTINSVDSDQHVDNNFKLMGLNTMKMT